MKDKKGDSIVDAFQKILDKSACKPNKKRGDEGIEFYYNSFKKWSKDDIEMYLIHNEGKSAVAERFVRTLKTKIYKYMNFSVEKCIYQ